MNTADYLIIGQGIAGTVLAHKLMQQNKNVIIIDNGHKHSSSIVAAGLINPITGRAYVKSWMIDQLLPVAIETYKGLEEILGINILDKRPVIRTIETVKAENIWLGRTAESEYQAYISESKLPDDYLNHFVESLSYGEINAYQVNLKLLLEEFRTKYNDFIRLDSFDHSQLKLESGKVVYKDITADKIVFCEGAYGEHNPLFQDLDFRPAKGEAIIVHIPNYKISKNLRHRIFVVHFGKDLYWIGSNYIKDFQDDLPSDSEKERLTESLKSILKTDFTIVDHLAGVRPATKHRKPFVGRHQKHQNVFILNGMGAKGSSLVPYFSESLIDIMQGNMDSTENGLLKW